MEILHAAAGILRRQISVITISDDEYPAPEEVSISNYCAPKCLSNFCCSLCDVQLSFQSEGRNSEKKVLAVRLK
jgi:hypothetical protein